jgi:Helix-turn-helix domain
MSLTSISDSEPRLSYSVEDFCNATGTKPAGVWKAIRRGEIRVARFGRRTLIPHQCAVEWLERLTEQKKA